MSGDNPTVKILVSYHKKDILFKDDILTPINAGRANLSKDSPDYNWLIENCVGDDTGDNISSKNKSYNEMTSIYWAWKNYQELGNPDYIGHFHYRRHMFFRDKQKSIYDLGEPGQNYYEDIGYSPDIVKDMCNKYEIIVPMPQWRASAYEHYKRNFDISELDLAIQILKKKFPDYSYSADDYLAGRKMYFYNMFIMRKDIFMEYCNFIFTILSTYEESTDITNKRLYISEWLTGIFINKKIKDQCKIEFLPTAMAQGEVKIPVVFATSNSYAMQTSVAITSLLSNKNPSTFYDIRCIVQEDFTNANKQKLLSFKQKYSNCSITFVTINEDKLNNICVSTSHVLKTTYVRLFLPDIFSDDKIIYLDGDVLVCGDLAVLYRYSLDNNYICAVKAPGYYYPDEWRLDKEQELGIKIDQYVNAGVLLMNLKLMRNEKVVDKFIKLIPKHFRSDDQDIINIVCYNRIHHIPFRFNVQTKYIEKDSSERFKLDLVIPSDEITDASKFPIVIHFASEVKPWQKYDICYADLWLKYARESPYSSQVKNLRSEKLRLISEYQKQLEASSSSIIRTNENLFANYELPETTTQPLISIITPCYNVEDTISNCLKSILTQSVTLGNIEIICVDDGSTDSTLNILVQWSRMYPSIKVYSQSNQGSGIARNLGLDVACGKYIAFMDADDSYYSPTTLENLFYSAEKNSVAICGGCFSSINGSKRNTQYKFPLDGYVFKERKIMGYSEYQYDFGYTRFIYSHDLIKTNNLRFPPYRRYQDPVFFAQAMIAAGKFMCVPECTYQYRIGHKNVNWDHTKLMDLLDAINDMFTISAENKLSKLYFYTFVRLTGYVDVIEKQIKGGDTEVKNLYHSIVSNIDYEFMKKADNYTDDYQLRKLKVNIFSIIKSKLLSKK